MLSRHNIPAAAGPGIGKQTSPPFRGVTLIEVLVGLCVLSLALGMAVEGIMMCRSIGARAAVTQQLTLAAQDGLSRAAAEPFDRFTSGTLETERILGGGEDARAGGGGGRIRASIAQTAHLDSPSLKEITIRASWVGGKQPLSVVLCTRVARVSNKPGAQTQAERKSP